MDFTHQDIRRIYGSTFFFVNKDEFAEVAITNKSKEAKPEIPPKTVEEAVKEIPPKKPLEVQPDPMEKFLGIGPMTNWKLKPNSTLALVVLKSEFQNREAMANLKNLIVSADIDTAKIGFGIVEDGQSGWNFSDMPVDQGILFLSFPEKLPSPAHWKDKFFYPAAPLSLIMSDERYAKAMNRLLQRVQASMK